jgi:iron(III) transport system substrate-binding protein
LREETEKLLIESGWSHLPIRPIDARIGCIDISNVKGMDVSLTDVYNQLERTKRELAEIFIR